MGATTVLPLSRLPRRTAAVADLYSRAPRLHINPACMANPSATKKPKRPGSVLGGQPPAKRARGAPPHLAAAPDAGSKNCPLPSSGKGPKSSNRLDAAAIKNQPVRLPIRLPGSTEQPEPSSCSMRELIEKARQAKAAEEAFEVETARQARATVEAFEIGRRREDARRKVEQIAATVEFNDPFVDPADVFMSPQQLMEAREKAAGAQARIMEMARQREMEALK